MNNKTALMLAAFLFTAATTHAAAPPDTILINAKIITADANDTVAEALAIRDGRLVAVGSAAVVEALAGPDTRHIDLGGAKATPGLLDAHLHLSSGGLVRLTQADLSFPVVRNVGDVVRVVALWRSPESLDEAERLIRRIAPFTHPRHRTEGDRLISGGIKLFADGSGGARTAWMWQDWNRERSGIDEGNSGYPAIEPVLLRDLITRYHDAGLHVGVHAVGDRAIDWTVAAMTLALIRNPRQGLRHSIIHSNVPTDLSLNTMAALQRNFDAGYPEPSPTFTWWIGDTYAGNFGAERSRRLNPFRSYLDRGMQWASGSDYGVTPFPARYGLWASISRQPLLGVYGADAFGKEQSVDARAALRSYTIWPARQMFLDEQTGSLEPGKYADIAVWDTDPYTADPEAIKNMQCRMTFLEGEVVFEL